eukprot:gene2884-3585_t
MSKLTSNNLISLQFLILCLSSLFIIQVYSQTATPPPCPSGTVRCGTQCIDLSTHKCLPRYGLYFVCPLYHTLCGLVCYNPNTQTCPDDTGIVCNFEPHGYCAGNCFSPLTQQCIHTEMPGVSYICLKTESLCKTHCFNPTTHYCSNNGTIVQL